MHSMPRLTFVAFLILAGCSSTASSGGGSVDAGDASPGQTGSQTGADSGSSGDSGASQADGGGAAHVTCEPPMNGSCQCIVPEGDAGAPTSCPPHDMPNPVCCAQSGYPRMPLSGCSCTNWVCNDTPSLCQCTIDSTGTATGGTCSSSHPYCCAHVLSDGSINGCTCGSFACSNGDMQVPACSPSVITCVGHQTKVASCQ
jgi:hypothetical protein